MRRVSTPYAEREVRPVYVPGQVAVGEPVAGFYRFKLGRDTIKGVVKIWFGPPHDPIDGSELDRSWRWQARFNDEPIDFDRCWPACVGDPVTEADYRAACARVTWARQHAPDSAYAEPGRKLDLLSTRNPLPF